MAALALALLLLAVAAAIWVATHDDPLSRAFHRPRPVAPSVVPQRRPEALQGERLNVPRGSR